MSYELINNCKALTVQKFVDCLIHKRYEVLIISGTPPEAEVSKAWEAIWNEYTELMNLPAFAYVMKLLNEIGQLYTRINIAEWCLKALSFGRHEGCIVKLNEIGLQADLPADNPGEYGDALLKLSKRAKSMVVEYQQKQQQYEDYLKSQQQKEMTEGDFMENLIHLSRYMGYRLNPSELSVYEYAVMLRAANKQALRDGKD